LATWVIDQLAPFWSCGHTMLLLTVFPSSVHEQPRVSAGTGMVKLQTDDSDTSSV
jgi:hypothetical protein